MTLFEFIKSKYFLRNLLIYLISVLAFFWIALRGLAWYTRHDELVTVPDFKGKGIHDLDEFIADQPFAYQIIDSVYEPTQKPGVVFRQDPERGIMVKEGRTVYLTITTLATPTVLMPNLVDRSLRQATAMLTSYGLQLGNISYKTDQCSNCVLDQLVNGRVVQPGAKLKRNAVVDLVVGKGMNPDEMPVPDLTGLNLAEVRIRLQDLYLKVGQVHYDSATDTLNGFVYKQLPAPGENAVIQIDGVVDVFFTTDNSKLKTSAKTD